MLAFALLKTLLYTLDTAEPFREAHVPAPMLGSQEYMMLAFTGTVPRPSSAAARTQCLPPRISIFGPMLPPVYIKPRSRPRFWQWRRQRTYNFYLFLD